MKKPLQFFSVHPQTLLLYVFQVLPALFPISRPWSLQHLDQQISNAAIRYFHD